MARPTSESAAKPLLEDGLKGLWWDWYRARVEIVHQRVSAYEILRRNGVSLRQVSDSRAEQIKCPFHGADNKPSAKVYPDSATRPSHVWCYVCQKSWDVIGLQMEFSQVPFTKALAELERNYNIEPPEAPKDLESRHVKLPDLALEEFHRLYDVCERRLKYAKESYQALDDMKGYITAGSVLDKVYFRVGNRHMPPTRGTAVLQQLLGKIQEKIQAGYAVIEKDSCPAG